MAEVVPGSKSRNLQQFHAHSKWSHREVIDHVAQDVDKLLGDERNACFLIDESGFAKQGNTSVGVSRQWPGRLGKVDKGQVALFGALADGQYVAPVDVRLYLPEKTTNRGLAFTRYQSKQKSIEVPDPVNSLPARSWKTMTLRKTTRGVSESASVV